MRVYPSGATGKASSDRHGRTALDGAIDPPTFGREGGAELADQQSPKEQPTTVEWIRAVLIVVLVATLAIAGIVAFAVAFVIQGCCAAPTPAL